MWYLKKTAQSVWNASKNLIQKRTPVQKLIDSIAESQQQFLPTNKLSQLAAMTYQLEQFDEIVQILYQRIKKFQYDVYQSHKTLNILITINYLIKHGATGFVDVFRKYVGVFKKYQGLKSQQTYQDKITQAKLDVNLQKIKSRAHHIAQLLQDKQKLLKQKQLSMLVKQKLKLYQKDKLSQLNNQKYSNKNSRNANKQKNQYSNTNYNNENENKNENSYTIKNLSNKTKALLSNPQQLSIKLQGLLQTYVWKYVDKLDESIQTASQKVMQQIDKYILGEEIHPFQAQNNNINDDEQNQINQHPVGHITKNKNNKEEQNDDDLMQKLQKQTKQIKNKQNTNLLQFQQVKPVKHVQPKQEQQDLI